MLPFLISCLLLKASQICLPWMNYMPIWHMYQGLRKYFLGTNPSFSAHPDILQGLFPVSIHGEPLQI
jgi:hypothetical protein